jgi:tight adherence protein C
VTAALTANPLLLGVLAGALAAAGATWMLVTWWAQPHATLTKTVAYLHRQSVVGREDHRASWGNRIGRRLLRVSGRQPAQRTAVALRLIERPVELHVGYLAAAGVAGFFVPLLLGALVDHLGLIPMPTLLPLWVALVTAVVAPLAVQSGSVKRAATVRQDMRHQLSAYLDVVTMRLAGNEGNEGALKKGATDGEGRLFVELRRRIIDAETAGRALMTALGTIGRDFDITELQQIAAAASLAAADGAAVSRSLAAQCSTLRSTIASEQEADARLRTGKITVPLVGMALIIMTLIIYPALNFSR